MERSLAPCQLRLAEARAALAPLPPGLPGAPRAPRCLAGRRSAQSRAPLHRHPWQQCCAPPQASSGIVGRFFCLGTTLFGAQSRREKKALRSKRSGAKSFSPACATIVSFSQKRAKPQEVCFLLTTHEGVLRFRPFLRAPLMLMRCVEKYTNLIVTSQLIKHSDVLEVESSPCCSLSGQINKLILEC